MSAQPADRRDGGRFAEGDLESCIVARPVNFRPTSLASLQPGTGRLGWARHRLQGRPLNRSLADGHNSEAVLAELEARDPWTNGAAVVIQIGLRPYPPHLAGYPAAGIARLGLRARRHSFAHCEAAALFSSRCLGGRRSRACRRDIHIYTADLNVPGPARPGAPRAEGGKSLLILPATPVRAAAHAPCATRNRYSALNSLTETLDDSAQSEHAPRGSPAPIQAGRTFRRLGERHEREPRPGVPFFWHSSVPTMSCGAARRAASAFSRSDPCGCFT